MLQTKIYNKYGLTHYNKLERQSNEISNFGTITDKIGVYGYVARLKGQCHAVRKIYD